MEGAYGLLEKEIIFALSEKIEFAKIEKKKINGGCKGR
jgi:hypothetical protein